MELLHRNHFYCKNLEHTFVDHFYKLDIFSATYFMYHLVHNVLLC